MDGYVLKLLWAVCFFSRSFYYIHSEAFYKWKLNTEGKIVPAPIDNIFDSDIPLNQEDRENQIILDILASTVIEPDGSWRKTSSVCGRQCRLHKHTEMENSADEILDCGKPVNFTYFDHLSGVMNRASHPHFPEPDVFSTFLNKHNKNSGLTIEFIEKKLKKYKRERPKSVELYNQIGNFWRVRGDTQLSIECFRRALAVSPNNAEILLNLARVLFNLQYLDDALFLTRRSLEVQPPDQNAWMQHYHLGEILRAYCHYQESALHLRHVLELKPNYGPALNALRDIESLPNQNVHVFTIVIIVLLVIGVLAWVSMNWKINIDNLLVSKANSAMGKFYKIGGRGGKPTYTSSASTSNHHNSVGNKARIN